MTCYVHSLSHAILFKYANELYTVTHLMYKSENKASQCKWIFFLWLCFTISTLGYASTALLTPQTAYQSLYRITYLKTIHFHMCITFSLSLSVLEVTQWLVFWGSRWMFAWWPIGGLIDRIIVYLHRERWTVRGRNPASDAAAVWSGDARASQTGDTSWSFRCTPTSLNELIKNLERKYALNDSDRYADLRVDEIGTGVWVIFWTNAAADAEDGILVNAKESFSWSNLFVWMIWTNWFGLILVNWSVRENWPFFFL